MTRHYIIGNYEPQHPSMKSSMYKVLRKGASSYAQSIGRELAEGPTQLIKDNEHFGPFVELWPLVIEEGVEYDLPR